MTYSSTTVFDCTGSWSLTSQLRSSAHAVTGWGSGCSHWMCSDWINLHITSILCLKVRIVAAPPKKKLNFCWFTNPSARLTPENSREKCDASPRLCHNSSSKLLGRTMIKIQPAYVYIYIYSNCFISLQEGAPRSDRFLFLAGQQLVFKTCQQLALCSTSADGMALCLPSCLPGLVNIQKAMENHCF